MNPQQQKCFKELKTRLSSTPVLHLPDFNLDMHLRTDASQFAVGGVLFQVINGVERPIAYTSRKMKPAELRYPTQQQELLAIVHALSTFRIYCLDRPPIVETDHKSLEGIFTQKMANRRLARWYDLLAEFQPLFSYLPGEKNTIADTLSRRPDLQPITKAFHDLSITSFDETSYHLKITSVTCGSDLLSKIKDSYKKDTQIKQILHAISQRDTSPTSSATQQSKQYQLYFNHNDLLWYQSGSDHKPRLVVPNDLKLKQQIIAEVHDTNYGGHPGTDRTYLKLRDELRNISMIVNSAAGTSLDSANRQGS